MEWYVYSASSTSDGHQIVTYRTNNSDIIEVTEKITKTADNKLVTTYFVNDGKNLKECRFIDEAFTKAEIIIQSLN